MTILVEDGAISRADVEALKATYKHCQRVVSTDTGFYGAFEFAYMEVLLNDKVELARIISDYF